MFLVTSIYDLPSGLTQDDLFISSHTPSSGRYQFAHMFSICNRVAKGKLSINNRI